MENPWDRQPTETDKAFEAFNGYLATGSIRAAFRRLPGKATATAPPGTWTGWSTKHHWVKRRAAFLDNTVMLAQAAELEAQLEISRNIKLCELQLTATALVLLGSHDSEVFLRAARAFTLQHPPIQRVEDVSERIEDLPDVSDEALDRMREIRDSERLENAAKAQEATGQIHEQPN